MKQNKPYWSTGLEDKEMSELMDTARKRTALTQVKCSRREITVNK